MKWFLLLLLLLVILFAIWWFMRRQSTSAATTGSSVRPAEGAAPTGGSYAAPSATSGGDASSPSAWDDGTTGDQPAAVAPMVDEAPAAGYSPGVPAPVADGAAEATSDWAAEVPETTETDEAVDLTADGDDDEPEVNIPTSTDDASAPAAQAPAPAAAAAVDAPAASSDGTTFAGSAGPFARSGAPFAAGAGAEETAYGSGSAKPAVDGSGPDGWTVKGNQDSMLYHSPESPGYARTRAEVWFKDEPTAQAAGFVRWDHEA